MSLAEKIRKAREVKVESAGFSFIIRRPTDLEMIEHGQGYRDMAPAVDVLERRHEGAA